MSLADLKRKMIRTIKSDLLYNYHSLDTFIEQTQDINSASTFIKTFISFIITEDERNLFMLTKKHSI